MRYFLFPEGSVNVRILLNRCFMKAVDATFKFKSLVPPQALPNPPKGRGKLNHCRDDLANASLQLAIVGDG